MKPKKLHFLNSDCLLRAILDAGLAVDALGHVHRFRLAAVHLEDRLGADVRAGAVSVALGEVDIDHDHVAKSSFSLMMDQKPDYDTKPAIRKATEKNSPS
jgi:hypothetical protein